MIKKIINLFLNKIKSPNDIKKYMEKGNSILLGGFSLDVRNPIPYKKYLFVGNDCLLGARFIFESNEGNITIGNRVFIGNSQFISRSNISLGNNIFIAWGCCFLDHDAHSLDYREREKDLDRHLSDYRLKKPNIHFSKNWDVVKAKPILIKDNAWIGMNSIILKGVTIGTGAVIGAGSVVTKDIPDWAVASGNPAKVVKYLSH